MEGWEVITTLGPAEAKENDSSPIGMQPQLHALPCYFKSEMVQDNGTNSVLQGTFIMAIVLAHLNLS